MTSENMAYQWRVCLEPLSSEHISTTYMVREDSASVCIRHFSDGNIRCFIAKSEGDRLLRVDALNECSVDMAKASLEKMLRDLPTKPPAPPAPPEPKSRSLGVGEAEYLDAVYKAAEAGGQARNAEERAKRAEAESAERLDVIMETFKALQAALGTAGWAPPGHNADEGQHSYLVEQLEIARAEVRACCGELEALDPWLPDGWEWRGSHWWTSGDRFGAVVWQGIVRQDGSWNVNAFRCRAVSGRERGILAAMAAAEKALAEAQEVKR